MANPVSLFLNAIGSMLVVVCGHVMCGVGIVGPMAGVINTLGGRCECGGLYVFDIILGVYVPSGMSKWSSMLSLTGVGSLYVSSAFIGAVLGLGNSAVF